MTTNKPLCNVNREGLPDLTPQFVDITIKAFVPNLCCEVNPVAIVYDKHVCEVCFKKLRDQYTGTAWDIH